MKAIEIAAIATVGLAASPAGAFYSVEREAWSLDVNGTAKLFPLLTLSPSSFVTESDESFVAFGSLRLNGELLLDSASLEIAYHVFPVAGDDVGVTDSGAGAAGPQGGLVAPVVSPLRLTDLDRELSTRDDFVLLQNLDRLGVTFVGPGDSEVRIGRQAISHGSARVFTATDIFSPFSPATLDSEYKQGLDAVRLTVPLDENQEVEIFAIAVDLDLDDSFGRGVYLARYRASLPEVLDASVYAGTSYGSPTLGVDVSGDLGGATVYAESGVRIWSQSAALDLLDIGDFGTLPIEDYGAPVRATLGGQYFFPFDLDVAVELHWNGAGATRREDYVETFRRPEWATGEIFLLGRAYIGTAWSYSSSALTRLSLSTITSLVDASSLLTPAFYWDMTEFSALSVGAILGVGRRVNASLVSDEFGLYPYTFFADARVYF
ncbi:MAG: hypothetical protein AAGJ56_08880 [Myxococcota bacterium]